MALVLCPKGGPAPGHSLHTGGVTGSIPVAPTRFLNQDQGLAERAADAPRQLAAEQSGTKRVECVGGVSVCSQADRDFVRRRQAPTASARLAGGKAFKLSSFGIGADPGHHEHRKPSTSVPTDRERVAVKGAQIDGAARSGGRAK
jgi:hypothetical protein